MVTLKQIAEELGISVTTVSKALKGYKDVSKKTKKLVKETASMLNYKPNSFAVNLRTKESKTIGLIIPEIVHHFFSSVIKGIIEQAEKKGYLVIILQSNESYELEKKQIDLLLSKRVDGILISLANGTGDYKHLTEIIEQETPIVMFDKIAKVVQCSKVIIDDRKAAYQATKHLIDVGCKRIAHFRGPLLPQNSIDRFLGYKQALTDHNLPYDSSLVYLLDDMSFEEGAFFANQLLIDHKDVDGIFINTDLVAIGAISEFNKKGIKIPEEINIIGFSNWFMASVISPSLTTVNQPGFEMGKKAFKILYKEIKDKKKNKTISHKEIVLDTELVIRESTN
ncbi:MULTISPECIES: LacI family DNA-binding transcriptional regulator [Tenacibaculum]|uniref:LacI family DNA-binding transcriptional regulator n=1 Tax=Tenacibaculum TaxID=104267 RepID=UPI001F0ABFF7|nr:MULTISPECIES: LacI family DNA-binding transcriptional regulator [Tenacibaculum]MCH3882020.1 LacI family transcriptional regulator [Tenacibaculum aquimarinum]MCH3885044.1 LacI family transcriptional regulator [Tenacibaculum aquimarinum]MDO6599661.1 LacI family DNA-binding transcriptional regulator [Tenacibaculum sp. 1_MG-2023]